MIKIDRNDKTLHFRKDISEFFLKSDQLDLIIEQIPSGAYLFYKLRNSLVLSIRIYNL